MCGVLVEGANKYVHKHFKDVMKTDEFLDLPKSDVLDIISCDHLNVRSEEQVNI